MKLILPIEVAADIEPHLPPDTRFVRVDSDGNLDDDASDAEVYLKMSQEDSRYNKRD